ncbi:hypothetical protein N7520_008719 [Penicillium odoratum]|uniref:uncharacterized protein n=1 Tax=Penicillium odoratum TaxID=1167516 RepID=UPI0025493648|nr:uncharacterized protein N7520_008719 [Penicillium odoratum]KAJ5751802.1 hypothetical protein N7520_008719 [Penicillium odoratum]
MYPKSRLALLAASWVFLGSVIGADQIVAARGAGKLEERDAACQRTKPPTLAATASSAGICPIASALCAACPGSTTTVTVRFCPSAGASTGGGSRSASGSGEGGSSSAPSSSAPSSSAPSSSAPSSSSGLIYNNSPASPSQTIKPSSTPLGPSRSSTPLISGSRSGTPPRGGILQTLPAVPATPAGLGAGAGAGSSFTPRAVITPGIVRRQMMRVMNMTAPFANTSSVHTNATSTLNMTRLLTSSTITEATGFRFHLRNQV